jgi:hypothetical protein
MLGGAGYERKLLVPCHLITLENSRNYLLDAYFMRSLEVPARRSLMIYPPEGHTSGTVWGHAKLLRPAYSVNEALGLLREAYLWACERRLNRAKKVLSRFRLSLLFPVAVFKKIENDEDLVRDSELAGSIYILEGVFGRRALINKLNIMRSEVAYIEANIRLRGGDENQIRVDSPNPSLARAYTWLYKNDTGFNKALREVLER